MADIPLVRGDSGGIESISENASSGTAVTIDLANGNVHDVTLTGGTATFTFTAPTDNYACSFTLILQQDGTGGRLVSWPASVWWPGSTAPTLSAAASAVDVFTFFTTNAGTAWYGFAAGTAMGTA